MRLRAITGLCPLDPANWKDLTLRPGPREELVEVKLLVLVVHLGEWTRIEVAADVGAHTVLHTCRIGFHPFEKSLHRLS